MMAQGTPSRQQMLKWVDMLSFAVQEANLYLDTHPSDQAALAYFQEYNQLRCQAAMAMGRRGLLNVEL